MPSPQQPERYVINLAVRPAGTAAAQASRWSRPSSEKVWTVCKFICLVVLGCYSIFLLSCLNTMIIQNFEDCGLPVCPLQLSLSRLYSGTATTVKNAEILIVPASTSNGTPSSMNNATAVVAPRGLAATHRMPFTVPVDVAPPKGQSDIPARTLEDHADQHILHNDTVTNPSTVPDPGLDHRRQKNLKPRTPADIPYNPPSKGNVVVLPGSGLRTDYIPPRFRKPAFAPTNNSTRAPTPTHNTTLINHPPTAPTNNTTHLAPTNTTNTLIYPALPPNTPFRRIFPAAPLPDSDSSSSQPPQTFLLPPLSPGGPPRLVNQAGEPAPIPLAVFMMWRKHRNFEGLLFDEVVPE